MSTWYDWYTKCWEAIYEKIAALSEFADADIIYGYKGTIEKYPTVYVCPGDINITPASLNMYDNVATIDIVLEYSSTPALLGHSGAEPSIPDPVQMARISILH